MPRVHVTRLVPTMASAMATVGVRDLRNRLTHYLGRAKRGEEVVVTERGRPVAILASIQSVEKPQSPPAQPLTLQNRWDDTVVIVAADQRLLRAAASEDA